MINEETARKLVTKALKTIADFDGDIDQYPTAQLQISHIKAFNKALSRFVTEEPVIDQQGNTHPGLQYSVPLSISIFKEWKKFGDCVQHLVNNHDISQL
jgi:hypothetical protein